MRKRIYSIICFFILVAGQQVVAQVPSFNSPPNSISANPAITTPFSVALNGVTGITAASISTDGDLDVPTNIVITPTTLTFDIRSKNDRPGGPLGCFSPANYGYAKGIIYIKYSSSTCINNISISHTVSKTFTPSPPIIGPSCVSPGDIVTYSVCPILSTHYNLGFDTYTWGFNTGNFTELYRSGDGSSITLQVGNQPWAGSSPVTCQVGQYNTNTPPSSKNVNCVAQAPLSITLGNPANISAGTVPVTNNSTFVIPAAQTSVSLIATAPQGLGYTYTWSTNNPNWGFGSTSNNTTPTAANIASGAPVVLQLDQNGGTVTLTTNGGCSSSSQVITFTITRGLSGPLFIFKSNNANCLSSGGFITFTVNNATNNANFGNASFTWQFPTSWPTPTTTTNTNSITVPIGSTTGIVSVSSSGFMGTLTVPVNVTPAAPPPITGASCVPATPGNQTYSLSPAPAGASSYTWSNTAGWPVVGAANGSTITYASNGTTSGTISVIAHNSNNTCSSGPVQLNINLLPAQPSGIITGGCWDIGVIGPACLPNPINGFVKFAVPNPITGLTYTWNVSPVSGGFFPNGNTGSQVQYNTNGTPGPYTVSVTASNACGLSAPQTLNIPAQPNGTLNWFPNPPGEYLDVTNYSTGSSFQWYSCNPTAPLPVWPGPGYANKYLFQNPAPPGTNYFVEVTDMNGCLTVLSGSTVNFSAKTKPGNNPSPVSDPLPVTISPNPASHSFTLVLPAGISQAKVNVFDNKGILVQTQTCKAGNNLFTTRNWAAGEYILQITGSNGQQVSKKLMISR